jgi:hypothetical protein
MPHSYTPTAIYHPTIIVPNDGDKATVGSVNATALQYLADISAYLNYYFIDGHLGTAYAPAGVITIRGDGLDAFPLLSNGLNVTDTFAVLQTCCLYAVGTGTTSGRIDLTQVVNNGGFSLSSNRITVPAAGTYQIDVSACCKNTDSANPQAIGYNLSADSTLLCASATSVPSGDDGGIATLSRSTLLVVTAPNTQRINLVYGSNTSGVAEDAVNRAGTLVIRRIF